MSINNRISELISTLENGDKKSLCKKTGIPQTTLSGIVGERQSDPASAILNKVLKAYPNINAKWLITGEGEKFETKIYEVPALESTINDCSGRYNTLCPRCKDKDIIIQDKDERIKELKDTISILKGDYQSKRISV